MPKQSRAATVIARSLPCQVRGVVGRVSPCDVAISEWSRDEILRYAQDDISEGIASLRSQ